MGSPELRARFVRSELALFRHRFETDDVTEREHFLQKQNFDWTQVTEREKNENQLMEKLRQCMPPNARDEKGWFKASLKCFLVSALDLTKAGPMVHRAGPRGIAQGIHPGRDGLRPAESADQPCPTSLRIALRESP